MTTAATAALGAPTGPWTRRTGEQMALPGVGGLPGAGRSWDTLREEADLSLEPWAPRQPLVHPSLAPGPLQTDRDPSRCCHAHDCCYGRLEKMGCEPKLERYLFSASKNNIFCGKRTALERPRPQVGWGRAASDRSPPPHGGPCFLVRAGPWARGMGRVGLPSSGHCRERLSSPHQTGIHSKDRRTRGLLPWLQAFSPPETPQLQPGKEAQRRQS